MSRPSAAKNAPPIEDDDDEGVGLPVQLVVPAAGRPLPVTSAARSAFDLARVAKPAPPAAIAVRKGVPLPASRTGTGGGTYRITAAAMALGDSVVLPRQQALNLMRIARDFGDGCTPRRHFVIRKLDEHTSGVWRDV